MLHDLSGPILTPEHLDSGTSLARCPLVRNPYCAIRYRAIPSDRIAHNCHPIYSKTLFLFLPEAHGLFDGDREFLLQRLKRLVGR